MLRTIALGYAIISSILLTAALIIITTQPASQAQREGVAPLLLIVALSSIFLGKVWASDE